MIYAFAFCFFLRALFLLAEENGKSKEALEGAEKSCGRYRGTVANLRDTIHETREALMSTEGFARLASLDEGAASHFYRIVEGQIARTQAAVRALTGSDCNVCLKVIKPKAFNGADGLETMWYSPAVPLERRGNSLVLPINQGLAAEALVTKQIVFSNDILEDDRFWPRNERQRISQIYRTAVVSPLIVDAVAYGVLCFDWPETNMFVEHDRASYAAFTDVITMAFYFRSQINKLVQPRKETK